MMVYIRPIDPVDRCDTHSPKLPCLPWEFDFLQVGLPLLHRGPSPVRGRSPAPHYWSVSVEIATVFGFYYSNPPPNRPRGIIYLRPLSAYKDRKSTRLNSSH